MSRRCASVLSTGPSAARSGWVSGCCCVARSRRSSGWLARGERLVEGSGGDGAGRGFLLVPEFLEALDRGDHATATALAQEVVAVAERFEDRDLLALGVLGHGQAALAAGQTDRGMRLLDEAMVSVTHRDLSPIADRDRLLRGDRGVHGPVRPAPGGGVDRGDAGLVRGPARPGAVPRALPGAPVAGPAVPRGVGRRGGRGGAGAPSAVRTRPPRAGPRALPAGRAAPAAR